MVPTAPSCSVSDLDTDARIVIRADVPGNVRQRSTKNIHIREGRLALGSAGKDFNHIRKSGPERPTALESLQVSNHSPDASHDSPWRRVAREHARVRVESAELVDESR